jgi:hypothetical protein
MHRLSGGLFFYLAFQEPGTRTAPSSRHIAPVLAPGGKDVPQSIAASGLREVTSARSLSGFDFVFLWPLRFQETNPRLLKIKGLSHPQPTRKIGRRTSSLIRMGAPRPMLRGDFVVLRFTRELPAGRFVWFQTKPRSGAKASGPRRVAEPPI